MPQGHKIDAILTCHPFTDHCHETTLRTGSPSTPIFVHHAFVDRVKGWKFFDDIRSVPVHSSKRNSSQCAPICLCTSQISTSSPKVTVAALYFQPDRLEMTGDKLHGCTLITITVSAPETSSSDLYYILYAPHGTYASVIESWIDANPRARCLALIHGFDEVDNPWYLGAQPLHTSR
jgi:hypothetical protein